MAPVSNESATSFQQELSQIQRKLITSLFHIAEVLLPEINDPVMDYRSQEALQSAAVDLAIAIENIRNLKRLLDRPNATEGGRY